MNAKRPGLTAAVVLSPSAAAAHDIAAGQGFYALALEGASLPFHTPDLVLGTVALSLFIGAWDCDGMPKAWPALLAGAVAGVAILPRLFAFDASPFLCALALGLALATALAWNYSRVWVSAATALTTAMICYAAVALHGAEGVPVAVLVGLFCGVNFFVSAISGLATLPKRQIAAIWPAFGLRIIASWLAATAMMMVALAFR